MTNETDLTTSDVSEGKTDTHMSASQIDAGRHTDKSFEERYELHDVGEAHLAAHIEDTLGLDVHPWGIDERDGEPVRDDRMDFKLYDEGKGLVGLVDVKTKSGHSYMGCYNARHHDDYLEYATELDVPTFVVMFFVYDDTIVDGFVYDVGDPVIRSDDETSAVRDFPDDNTKVYIPQKYRHELSYLNFRIQV